MCDLLEFIGPWCHSWRACLLEDVLLSHLRKDREFSIVVEHVFLIFNPSFCFFVCLLYPLCCESEALQERKTFVSREDGISTAGI